MRQPVRTQRRVRGKQIKLGAVVVEPRAVNIGKHPPFAARFEQHRIRRLYSAHQRRDVLPFQRELGASIQADLPRAACLRAHVELPPEPKEERKRQVKWLLKCRPKLDGSIWCEL